MREIIIYPNYILTIKAEEVDPNEISIFHDNNLFEDMKNVTFYNSGVGLAAPQLGVSKRIIYILDDLAVGQFLINPVITVHKGKATSYQEGCLSLPGQRFDIKRAREVVVHALNAEGEPVVIRAKRKITAIVLQHEIDHLNGILILNRRKGGLG